MEPLGRIHTGPYKGDISALRLLTAPGQQRYPFLLAGADATRASPKSSEMHHQGFQLLEVSYTVALSRGRCQYICYCCGRA
ncbi:hypothetical protein GOP47_0031061 [Adiantum capillus-veneris]|nr:hypothetical protein GOP47_0031061 [Adiantum capillus-veneris]